MVASLSLESSLSPMTTHVTSRGAFPTFFCIQVMMAHERCGEEDAEAILSNLKMEGRCLD